MTGGNWPPGQVLAADGIGRTASEAREPGVHPINVTSLALSRRVAIGVCPPPLRYARGLGTRGITEFDRPKTPGSTERNLESAPSTGLATIGQTGMLEDGL